MSSDSESASDTMPVPTARATTQPSHPNILLTKQSRRPQHPVRLSTSDDNVDSPVSSPSTPLTPSKLGHWIWAAKKGRRTSDPWACFRMEDECASETALRYRYDAKNRTWATDEITIKLQSEVIASRGGDLLSCFSFVIFCYFCVFYCLYFYIFVFLYFLLSKFLFFIFLLFKFSIFYCLIFFIYFFIV